jgi:16S rRNA (uracil1498-N3)-methyltransferase
VSLPHFFGGAPQPGETLILTGEEARHARGSLRLRPGDRLTSGDGEGAVAACVVERVARDEVVALVEDRDVVPRPTPHISVHISAPKGERLTWAVQKLTEIGADSIVLVEASRSVRRWWSEEQGQNAARRLQKVAREAAKQSRRAYLPGLGGPIPWDTAVEASTTQGLLVVLWERAESGLRSLLPAEAPEPLGLLVGPEGGIPDEDARAAEKRGARLASLGRTILRTETAALVAATLALAAYGRLDR